MISFIKGTVAYKEEEYLVVENHGIGYQIKTTSRMLSEISTGQEVMIYTYLYVREDALSLFGFSSKEELNTFRILLGISGIGPKAALSVLSTMTVEDLYYAVCSEDVKSIARTPGIGPKGARRMIIELKDKLKLTDLESEEARTKDTDPAVVMTDANSVSDTIQALMALGYSNGEAFRAVHNVKDASSMDAEQLLKEALKVILTFS
ncbi:MAG: Holliday junction branch migration protein RuvA [Eubacterium sp.]|nr:Holliday junction branch migration protein RuvA [Eubacterium sp.]MDD7209432.1 Holliday junction branch migration protein RuvA [Lachnospiraceae bacterium]MDY5497478.1 Holliday junction branch migration protein RuvA [Anaerobutyricum sp.]